MLKLLKLLAVFFHSIIEKINVCLSARLRRVECGRFTLSAHCEHLCLMMCVYCISIKISYLLNDICS